jgi:hypothetical protein
MVKWLAFSFALLALFTSADERKVRNEFEMIEMRLKAIEGGKCLLMVVLTPTGQATVCASAP